MDELVFEVREMLAEITAAQHPDVAAALLEGALDGDRSFVVLSVLEALVTDGAGAGLIRDAERLMVDVARTAPTRELVRAACRVAQDLSGAAAAELAEQWRAAAAMAVADGRENVLPVGPADEAPLLLAARDRRESCSGRDGAMHPCRGRGVASIGGAGRGPRGTGPGRGDRSPLGRSVSVDRRPGRAKAGRSPPGGPRRCGTPRVRPPPRRAPVRAAPTPRSGSRLPGIASQQLRQRVRRVGEEAARERHRHGLV